MQKLRANATSRQLYATRNLEKFTATENKLIPLIKSKLQV